MARHARLAVCGYRRIGLISLQIPEHPPVPGLIWPVDGGGGRLFAQPDSPEPGYGADDVGWPLWRRGLNWRLR